MHGGNNSESTTKNLCAVCRFRITRNRSSSVVQRIGLLYSATRGFQMSSRALFTRHASLPNCGGGGESSRVHKLQQQYNSSASVRQLAGCSMNDIDTDERDSDTEHENDKENVNKSTGTGSSTINRKAGAVNSSSSRGNISKYAFILRTYISIARSARQTATNNNSKIVHV
jgi:hypothetical protein